MRKIFLKREIRLKRSMSLIYEITVPQICTSISYPMRRKRYVLLKRKREHITGYGEM